MNSISRQDIAQQLKKVFDPELGVNIVDLGLVYEIFLKKNRVEIMMTLTTMGCPLGPYIVNQISAQLTEHPGIEHVNVEFVWTPAWNQSMMSDEARELLLMGLRK